MDKEINDNDQARQNINAKNDSIGNSIKYFGIALVGLIAVMVKFIGFADDGARLVSRNIKNVNSVTRVAIKGGTDDLGKLNALNTIVNGKKQPHLVSQKSFTIGMAASQLRSVLSESERVGEKIIKLSDLGLEASLVARIAPIAFRWEVNHKKIMVLKHEILNDKPTRQMENEIRLLMEENMAIDAEIDRLSEIYG
jgi:hypothetical protein